MKHFLFFASIVIIHLPVLAQQVVLQDDFSGNTNNWPVQTAGTDQSQLADGKYILEGFSDSTRFAAIPVNLDSAKNYSISVSATHISGVNDYEYGLYITDRQGKNACAFVISANGYYKFYGYVNGIYSQFYDWTAYPGLNKGSNTANTITLNKTGGDWVMYLNDQWVAAVPIRFSLTDLQIGFIRSNRQKVAFDDFVVTALN